MPNPSRFDSLRALWGPALATLLLVAAPHPCLAGHTPFAARAGLEIATAAAQSWAQDATLVYLENDEDLDARGAAERWGYLFFSPATQKARAYSVRDGRIVTAENLDMSLEAPPIATGWIDSGTAIEAAEREVGKAFQRQSGSKLSTMLLMRG